MSEKTAIIMGVGASRGLGATLCRRFGSAGLHVIVAGRTAAKIETVAAEIIAAGGKATAIATDTTDEAQVVELFNKARAIGELDLAIYNAGNNMPAEFLKMEAGFFEQCWRVACYGGFLFSREALRYMEPRGHGTLLFTGASASMRGRPFFAAFAAAKAGLRALAQSVAREFGPKGIHVAHLVIDGGIDGDRINKGLPDFAAAMGEDGLINLEGIADLYELLYKQSRGAWSHEIDVRTFKETF
ncbi:MAG: NAD(P)-dependent dehydrogenase (short-subunit alcohol dehydrogenase family) [Hyphomicrobiaceae bacterium]|jgi:NAD(P)-dependent dehydrogenase (short-subunit alcohol dehydrogenase family)